MSASADDPDPTVPLTLRFCVGCSLLQIAETVDPELLFSADYPYYSSFSPALLEHSRRNAEEILQTRALGPGAKILEVASNDGYLLKNFVGRGMEVLGVDPAAGPAAAAERAGVPSRRAFFGLPLARQLAAEGFRADVLFANNVLAHVAGLNDFVAAIATTLAPAGVAVLEVPYALDLIEKTEFDTIYHQHLCYFSVCALDALFRRHGLHLNDVRRLSIHGGSLRLFVEPQPRSRPAVQALLDAERAAGAADGRLYEAFGDRVRQLRTDLCSLIARACGPGASLAAYGAAAKGTTLLSYCGLDRRRIPYAVDRNHHKHGLYMPGSKLLIRPTEALLEDQPDYLLLLAWNFADEILEQQAEYRARGGRFIIPVPVPRVV